MCYFFTIMTSPDRKELFGMTYKASGRILLLCLALVLLMGLAACGSEAPDADYSDFASLAEETADTAGEEPGDKGAAQKEYPLYWPDITDFLDEDSYTKEQASSKVTFNDDENYGLTAYRGTIRLDKDAADQLEDFIDYLQDDCHFKLVSDEDDSWYFRFTGSNAPAALCHGGVNYHCSIVIKELMKDELVLRYLWMTDFSTNPDKASMTAKQTESETKSAATPKPTTAPKPTATPKPAATARPTATPKPAAPATSNDSLTIQHPCKFFGCATGEDFLVTSSGYDGDAWIVSCKFDLDTGKQVVGELITLLDEEYPFDLCHSTKQDSINVAASVFYNYYYEYTGSSPLVDGFNHEDTILDEVIPCDVQLAVYYNYRGGWIMVSMYFDPIFTLENEGHRASMLPEDYTGASEDRLESVSNPNWKKNVLECTDCEGSGDCDECNSSGFLWSSASDSADRNCWRCGNSGVCQTCFGTGDR